MSTPSTPSRPSPTRSWERRLAEALLRYRWLALLVIAAVSAVAAMFVGRVAFDADIEIWFLENDPALVTYHAFVDEFQVDDVTVLAVFADDVFEPEVMGVLDALTRAVADAPHVLRTRSLTNARVVESKGAFFASIGPLVDSLPQTAAESAALRKRALGNPLVREYVVSRDGRAAAIIIETDPEQKDFDKKVETVNAVNAIAKRLIPAGLEWHLAGASVLDTAFFEYTERDFKVLGPAAALVALLLCLLIFHRPIPALLPLLVVLLANLWTFGVMGMLGLEINIVSTALFAVILAVGIADTVHVVTDFQQELAAGYGHREAVVRSLSALIVPCCFTSLTTIAGFASLLMSDMKPIDEFGALAALGVVSGLLLSLTLVPAVLSLLPTRLLQAREPFFRRALSYLLAWAGKPRPAPSRVIVTLSALVLAAGVWTLGLLQVGANPMNFFHRDEPARLSTARVDQGLGASATYELRIQTQPGGLKDPQVLRRMQDLEERLESQPAITRVMSVLDTLKEVRRVMTDGKPESARLPDSRQMAAQFYLMIEGDDDFRRNVRGDYELTRMTAMVRLSESGELTDRSPQIRRWLAEDFSDAELRAESTGSIKLMSDMERYLLESQIRSLGVAFLVVTLMMLLLLRSFKMMLLSMIPNLVPVVMGLSLMAVASIALDPGTVMIGSMALGLVVDDTVHFLVRLRRNLRDVTLEESIHRSMQQTGHAIVFTSVILAAGLGVLALGSFRPNAYFGVISAFVIVVALIADLVVLPALLVVWRPNLRR